MEKTPILDTEVVWADGERTFPNLNWGEQLASCLGVTELNSKAKLILIAFFMSLQNMMKIQ